MDEATRKRLLSRREHCLHWAERVPNDPVRDTLLNLAKLYEIELDMRERSARCVADSRELLIKVDHLLDPNNLHAPMALRPTAALHRWRGGRHAP